MNYYVLLCIRSSCPHGGATYFDGSNSIVSGNPGISPVGELWEFLSFCYPPHPQPRVDGGVDPDLNFIP